MANSNAFVSRGIRLDRAREGSDAGGISVELDGERRAVLKPDDRRTPGFTHILEELAKQRRPVYLEINPDSAEIERLLIPHVGRVTTISAERDGYSIELEYSHARHRLDRGTPDFEDMELRLRGALAGDTPLIVTEDDAHRIIDVRPYLPGPDDGPLPKWPKPEVPVELPWWRRLLWRWPRGCISAAKAQQVLNAMGATSCDPLTVPPPCIPFLYPDDGCWGRAHEMCRLMIAMGLSPRKVWIQGNLHTPTRNNPACFVGWSWHVAPTLCVRRRWFRGTRMVIDPSLFTTPVTQAAWKAVQGDPAATLTPSGADIFYLWGNSTDPTYAQTNQVLNTYRLQLLNRSLQVGPPPYANCP